MDNLKLPEGFDAFDEERKNSFLALKEFKEKGGRLAGVFCAFTPMEVLDCAGFAAVKIHGMSEENVTAGEGDLPKNLCPLVKSLYGAAVNESCPRTYFADILVGETTCDGRKKMYDILGEGKEMYLLQVPQGTELPYAKKLWRKELRFFIRHISQRFGVEITDDMLRAAAKRRNEYRAARLALMEMQKAENAPLSGRELYCALEKADGMWDLEEAIAYLRDTAAKAKEAQCPVGARRILISGCPMGGIVEKIVGAVEKNGGRVVCFENCIGVKAASCMVDTEAEDIIDAIADAYLETGCAVMSPNRRRMESLKELFEEYAVEGLIDMSLQACTSYMIETRAVRSLCKEQDMPYLYIETDQSSEGSGQLDTRVAAFIEML